MIRVIRTGILFVPELDPDTSIEIRKFLGNTVPEVVVVMESYAASQRNWVEDLLRRWCDEEELDLVLTVGATMPAPGPGSLEIVPDATEAVLERHLPGFGEAMRAHAQEQTALALMDRGMAGIRGRSLIVNLPHGSEAALLFLEAISGLILPVHVHLGESLDRPSLSDVLAFDAFDDEDALYEESDGEDVPARSYKGLDGEEFADFLQRRAADRDTPDGEL